MKNTLILLLAGAVVIFSSCGNAGENNSLIPSSRAAKLHAPPPVALPAAEMKRYHDRSADFFDSLLIRHRFNGSILVAKKGVIVYEKYCGYINPALRKDTFTQSTAFHLASVSKTFTAMGILKLYEEGKLGLNDSLGRYFPGFPYPAITLKMLLSHRSGLPNYTHYLEAYKWDKNKMVSNNDVLNSFYTLHPRLDFTSGKHFAYCNTNYALLALIIEKVSGESYPDFMKHTFFIPLNMQDTYVYTPADEARSIASYQGNNRPFAVDFLDNVYGDKNVYSTVRDLLKWDQALYAGKLFSQETLDAAFTPYSFEKPGQRNYGLGWRMTLLDNGKKLLYHNGWWHGNNTVFIRLIDEKATIIVLGNKFNRQIYSTKELCNMFGDYEDS